MADLPQITMYSTDWCGYCRIAKRFFNEHAVPFEEINIERDDAAAEYVMSINNGNRTVPTIVIDGVGVYTNPSTSQLKQVLGL